MCTIIQKIRLFSFDFRGHGYNTSSGDNLSVNSLINDTVTVLKYISETYPEENIIILGHSMGGAIATKTCAYVLSQKEKFKVLYSQIQGLICIDVVEGSAMDALPFMENVVHNRPPSFQSIDKAIEYMFKSGTIQNIESARISVPPLLKESKNKKGETVYEWKTDLLASKKYWVDWFLGLTKAFL